MCADIVSVLPRGLVHGGTGLQLFTYCDAVSLSYLLLLSAALFTNRAEGPRPLHLLQIFAGLGFSGFSSYRKSIPEVASSHMVLIGLPSIFSLQTLQVLRQ